MAIEITRGDRVILLADRHAPYIPEIERCFEVYFGAVEPQSVEGRLVADFSAPRVHRYRHSGMEFEIAALPEEPAALAAYWRHYQPTGNETVFDVGAYCGLSVYEAAQRVGRVVAFEPDSVNRRCLERNIQRHSLRNVQVVPAAMAATSGEAIFFEDHALGSRLAKPEYRRPPLLPVPVLSFADACARFGTPAFISMDIEGAEVDVLGAASAELARGHFSLAVDTNHGPGGTARQVETILRGCGYQVETSSPAGLLTTWAWKE